MVNNDIFYVSEWLAFSLPLNKNISKYKAFLYKYYDRIKRVLKLRKCVLYKFNMKENKLEVVSNSYGLDNNGVAYDKDNKLLFMALTLDKNIRVYQLNEKGDVIKVVKDISTGYTLDNLYFDNSSKLLFAAIMGIAKNNFEFLDPSKGIKKDQVFGGILVYDFKKDDKPVYTFLQNHFIKEVSSGMIIGDNIYLSSFYDKGILKCQKLK